jgi:hypothetical protein
VGDLGLYPQHKDSFDKAVRFKVISEYIDCYLECKTIVSSSQDMFPKFPLWENQMLEIALVSKFRAKEISMMMSSKTRTSIK